MKIHINLHVVAFVAAMMALGAQAEPVSSAENVVAAVSAWSSANGATFAGLGTAVSAEAVCDDDGTNVLYWVVKMSNGGAVIASPDTDLDLVVSVLENYGGSFPEGHPLPSILKRDMRNRLALVLARRNASGRLRLKAAADSESDGAAAKDAGIEQSVKAANAQWSKYGVKSGNALPRLKKGDSLDDGDSSPFVRRIVDGFETDGRYTFWDQSEFMTKDGNRYVTQKSPCFNFYTPKNAVCGCVATAGSAILQFFNCTNNPGTFTSEKASYNGTAEGFTTIAGDTDWSILPARFGGASDSLDLPDDAGYELLGRVAYNMGVLVDMAWTSGESGASLSALTNAFHQYGFKTARYVRYSGKEDADGTEFFKTIYAQVWCGAPVAIGISGASGGHAVVACGYARDPDGDEFCRVFMGWSGRNDAWYKFPKVASYVQVDGAVTMIGYVDDAVVPVYGETNIPGDVLTLPGYETNGVPVTVQVNEHGYFGIRVPVGLEDKSIVYEPRGRSADIQPFDASVITNETASLDDLNAAIPNEIYFPIMNMTVKQTMDSACAVAARDGKALLMVGGTVGTDYMKLLTEYINSLDEVSDLSNRFVYVVLSSKSSNWNEPDGDPVIGVFDPVSFVSDERWQESNGRLDYENFIDSDATGETNVIVRTFSADDTASMHARVDELLENGYAAYLRRRSGIQVTVRGVNFADKTFANLSEVEPAYGVVENAWTNGETAVFTAPGAYTNAVDGIVYSCVGWTTNAATRASQVTNYTAGSEAQLQLVAGTTNTLTWVWDISHYRVTASAALPYATGGSDEADAVTPPESWVPAGDRVTITAQESIGHYNFSYWDVMGSTDYYKDSASKAAVDLADSGASVSFTVNEPVTVTANYRRGGSAQVTKTYTLILHSSPESIAANVAPPLAGSYVWGENTLSDPIFKMAGSASATDATGGVWKCTGWLASDDVIDQGGGSYRIPASGSLTLTFLWERDDSSEDPSQTPTPKDIAISSVEHLDDVSWTITVSGAVKDCWYWLYAADDLSAVAGSGDGWTAGKAVTAESNPQKAAADGNIVFHATAEDAKLFWRAKATSTEDGK